MEFFRSIFPEDPDEDEVNRAMLIGLLTTITVAGSIYLLGPAPRIRAWWNRTTTPTPMHFPAPMPSRPIVADNRAINRNLPGSFVEQDGDDQDISPDDFRKPFWQYTERDVANMKAAWSECFAGRAADSTACTERISRLQTEAANTRQTERIRVAVEARRADAAESRANAAEARAGSAENELLQVKTRFVTSKLFRHHADDEKLINQLCEDKKDLQRQLDACVDSGRRSLLPKEVEELQMQLEHALQEASDAKKNLISERRRNINISLRGNIAEKLIAEHGRSSHVRCRLNQARTTVSEQKNMIEQQRLDLEEHSANAAEQRGRLDASADALEQYKTANSEQKRTIEKQEEEQEQRDAELQNSQAKESELVALNQQLQQKYSLLFKEFQRKETSLEESEKTLDEARETQNKSDDVEAKLRVDIDELNSEVNTKDITIERLRNRIAALRRAEHSDAACENCKTLQGELTRLKGWQRSQQASFRLDRKKYADMEVELKKAKVALDGDVTAEALFYINKAKLETRNMKEQRETVQSILNTRNDDLEKKMDKLNALKLAKGTGSGCEERCHKSQAEADGLKAAAAAIDCEGCKKLQANVDTLNDYFASEIPAKRVQQLMSRDATIEALQQELAAAKANTDEVEQPGTDSINSPTEIEQLKSWLEETRIALCWMLGISSGEPTVLSKEGTKPNELAQLLREVKEKCERVEAWECEVNDLQKELKGSNLADCREEIQTLKEHLATSQADLFEARAPAGPLKPDNKIRQIIGLKQQVVDLQSQLSKTQDPAPAAEDPSWKAKFDASELRLAESTAKFAGLEAELTQALSSAPVGDADAQKTVNDLRQQLKDYKTAKSEAQQKFEKYEAQHAELIAALEHLKTQLKQTKQERDDCRNTDLPSSKQKIEQLEIEVDTVRKAFAAGQADLETAKEELETLRNAKSSGTESSVDAAAQRQIRVLTARLDASKVALGKSRAEAEEQTTKTGELIAQVDRLQGENAGAGSKYGAKISTLQQECDAAKSETTQIRQQATQEIQQAKNETEQLRADATEKIQQAELQIQTIKNTTTNPSNQNGEIQRLQTTNNDLAAKLKDLDQKLKAAYGQWDHWGALATNSETQRITLGKALETERNQLKAANAACVAKENQIQQLKTQLENAKAVETAALADLHGEGKAVIDNLQQQLDREKKAHEIVFNAHSSLRMRAFEIEQERDALKQAVLADATNNPTAIENTTLRQQVTELQRRLTDDNNHFTGQIFDLTAAVNAKDQTIAGLNSKYKGHIPARSTFPTVPQHVYDNTSKENTLLRQENLRLRDFQSKWQDPSTPRLSALLQDEQIRRVKAEDRYNKLFPQIELLRKQLRDYEDSAANAIPTSASDTETANLAQVIQLNNTLRATIIRNNTRSARQLVDLGRDRDQLLQRVSDIQRQAGDTELADLISTVRELSAKNAELQAWRDEHEFMVQQADVMAEAERKIAAAQGDLEKARGEIVDAGFGTRGTVRKEYERGGEENSPPRKESKQLRVERVDDEELFG